MKRSAFYFLLSAALASNAAENEFALGVRTTDPLSATEQRAQFILPKDFEIQLVASEPDINKPMNMAFDATGRLWVTTSREYPFPAQEGSKGRDRLMIFEDFGEDGRARKVTEFADGLNIPIGIYPFRNDEKHWKAVVWSIPNIWLMEDTDGDGKADKREVLYGPFDYSRDTHGNQSSFTRGFDGWLYATHGFNNHSKVTGRDGNTVDMHSGNTYRMRLDGSRIEHFTHGQVNPFGMHLDSLGNFYTADCHSAPIYQLLAGGYYPSFGKPHDGLGFAPVMLQHSHGSTAISGIVKYEDNLWPDEYKNRMFIGNVMTSAINQDEVSWIGSTPVAKEMDDFVKSEDPWFRPVNLQLGPDGALYIADFYNRIIGHYEVPLKHPGRDRERGRIWRVVYKNKPLHPIALPNEKSALFYNELKSPNITRRLLALNELGDRRPDTADELLKTRNRFKNMQIRPIQMGPLDQANGLWLWNRFGDLSVHYVASLAEGLGQDMNRSLTDLVRGHALRILIERGKDAATTKNPSELIQSTEGNRARKAGITGLNDSSAHNRRCAAEVLGAWPSIQNLKPLLSALLTTDPADTHLVYVLRNSIRDQLSEDTILANIDSLELNDEQLSLIARLAVAVKSEPAGDFLIQHRNLFADDQEFSGTAFQHAARYAAPDSLDQLAQTIRNGSAANIDFQLTVFNSIQAGMNRRGLPLSSTMTRWAGELAVALLESVEDSTDWLNEPVDEFSNPKNPWAFQARVQADTRKPARMLSSFPHGEGLTGRLISKTFSAPEQLTFYLSGHDGYPDKPIQNKNYVQLRDVHSREIIQKSSPPRNDTAQKIAWDLSKHAGKLVQLEVVDGDTAGAYAWLAIGRIKPQVVELPSTAPARAVEREIAGTRLALSLGSDVSTELNSQLVRIRRNPTSDLIARANVLESLTPSESHVARIVRDNQIPAAWRRNYLNAQTIDDPSESAITTETVFNEASSRVQARALTVAIAGPDEAEFVVSAIESDRIAAGLLQDEPLREKLLTVADEGIQRRVDAIVAMLPARDQSMQEKLSQRYRSFGPAKSNSDSGQILFDQLCAACHQLNGKGSLVGPQLDGIGNRGAERLIEDILDPNRNVDTAFRTSTFVMKNGDVESGLFRREDGALIIVANSAGQEFNLNKADVDERHESTNSLMPSNFGEALTQDQFNDLLGFLLEQR